MTRQTAATLPSHQAMEAGGRGALTVRERFRVRAVRALLPLNAMLELTQRCNLTCGHCYLANRQGLPQDGELTTADWFRVIDELAAEGCMSLTVTGGEITLREDWLDIVAHGRGHGLIVSLLTNGTHLPDEDIARLAELKVRRVGVSLYGSCAETHDAVTGVPGSFDKTVDTVRRLRAAGIQCRVGSVLMGTNVDECLGVMRFAQSTGSVFRTDAVVRPCDDGDTSVVKSHRMPIDALREFFSQAEIAEGTAEGRIIATPEPPAKAIGNCGAGRRALYLDAGGDMWACMGMGRPWGNVRRQAFAAIWKGAAATEHRRRMDLPLEACHACEVERFCTYRCPRLAEVEDGDMSGPSTAACDIAHLVKDMWHERQTQTLSSVTGRSGDRV